MKRAALLALSLAALVVACGSDPPTPEPDPWCRIGGLYPCLDFLPQDADGGFTLDAGGDAP
jgi:hypothetical protein